MKRKTPLLMIFAALMLVVLLMVIVISRGRREAVPEPADAVLTTEPAAAAASAAPTEAEAEAASSLEPAGDSLAGSGRRAGERLDGVIVLEGMEETVHYEHVRNDALGFEMDYDYERFVRRGERDRECFVSCWDDPDDPENYLEVKYSPLDAEAAAAAICETLSNDYEISRNDSFPLDTAGSCIRIDASADVGGLTMPDQLREVYIVPAADGCRVAAARCAAVESEGFLRRFGYMMNSFSAVADPRSLSVAGMWQSASMAYADGGNLQPEYYVRFTDSEILYGHLKDGQFVFDRADGIASLEQAAGGGIRVQAESSNGVRYTYQTCESDDTVLEYYETWREEDFPEQYRGGASLSRCG